jgi:uncharacterized membrane protein
LKYPEEKGKGKTSMKSEIGERRISESFRISLGVGLMGLMLLLGGAALAPISGAEGPSPSSKQLLVLYPTKTFEDGKAHFFEHKTEKGMTIKYFILKSSDGAIRAAFDACDVCWPEGKGYLQKGDFMVCRNCGQQFASIRVNEVKGGCNPAPLAREIKEGNVVIKVGDLLEGSRYFNFTKKG